MTSPLVRLPLVRWVSLAGLVLCPGLIAEAGDAASGADRSIAKMLEEVLLSPVFESRVYGLGAGVKGRELQVVLDAAALAAHALEPSAATQPRVRVLLVGGLDGSPSSTRAVLGALEWFGTAAGARPYRETLSLAAIPVTHPDALSRDEGRKTSAPTTVWSFPPAGTPYRGPFPAAQYLWRWVGSYAPDLVVEVLSPVERAETDWRLASAGSRQAEALARTLAVRPLAADGSLAAAVARVAPLGGGTIPALSVTPGTDGGGFLPELLKALDRNRFTGEDSPARQELLRRLRRTPLEVVKALRRTYGHELERVTYIPALALIGRLWSGAQEPGTAQLDDVERIVAPFVTGERAALPENPGGVSFAGHLVFAELARLTGQPRYTELARAAADFGFESDGRPKPAMPGHSEMSDAVFMGCPILARVGALTGESKYFDMALRHLRFIRRLTLREDGLYRHSPLDETAWGRGNGFPALGVAMTLTYVPRSHGVYAEMLAAYRAHMAALARHQDETGSWHQVVDYPASYRELTSTCMVTFAMLRGLRQGWLERAVYEPLVERAWRVILSRVADDGTLVDVCASTGKQPSLQAYLERPARVGRNSRGGAMALLVSNELIRWRANH